MEGSKEDSPRVSSVSLTTGSFSVGPSSIREDDLSRDIEALTRNMDLEESQERPRESKRQSRGGLRSLAASSFRGSGLGVTWDKDADAEENQYGKFDSGYLEAIFEDGGASEHEDATEEDAFKEQELKVEEMDEHELIKAQRGNGIMDKNVFVLELLSNKHIRLAIGSIYLAFIIMVIIGQNFARNVETSYQYSFLPENATGSDLLCNYQPDGSCVPDAYQPINADQASLLMNTVIVSDGINVSDWENHGAKPGTPPFTAHKVVGYNFMASPSVLDYDANSDLHPFWDDIVAVFWSGGTFTTTGEDFKNLDIRLRFTKHDGDWPKDIVDAPFAMAKNGFTCVKGGEDYCDSVGNWRIFDRMGADKMNNLRPKLKESNVLDVPVGKFLTIVNNRLFESNGVRHAVTTDPYGIVSDCLQGNNCKVELVISGDPQDTDVYAILNLCAFAIFLGFFIWWLMSLKKRKGAHEYWPREDWWLVFTGVGFLLQLNLLRLGLLFDVMYSSSFVFHQGLWASGLCLHRFGTTVILYSFALFIDAPRRYVVSRLDFHKYKIPFFLCLVTTMMVTTLYNFPKSAGYDQPGTDLKIGGVGFGTVTRSWNQSEQNILYVFSLTESILIAFSYVYYFWKCHVGFKLLDKLPYGMTRHTQLSFRFIVSSSVLWMLAAVAIIVRDVIIVIGSAENTVLRLNQALTFSNSFLVAPTVFRCTIIIVLHIFFLPPYPEHVTRKGKTHHITEEEAEEHRNSPKWKGRYLMVLDKAKLLGICSNEVYLPFDKDEALMMVPPAEAKKLSTLFEEEEEESNENGKKKEGQADEYSTDESLLSNPDVVFHEAKEESDQGGSVKEEQSALDDTEQHPGSNPGSCGTSSSGVKKIAGLNALNKESSTTEDPSSESISIRFAGDPEPGNSVSSQRVPDTTHASGCRVVARIYETGGVDLHDTRAIIFRNEFTDELIVSFRGTATKRQVKTDVMIQKIGVDLDTFLAIPKWRHRLTCMSNHVQGQALMVENMLHEGNIRNLRLIDLLPRSDEELPKYLKKSQKARDGISGVGQIHFGFWSSYNRVRAELHEIIRDELVARPGRLILTGHSLGGAQATLCAYDMCRWVVPTVKKLILTQRMDGRAVVGNVRVTCYTFGSPRVGGPMFAKAYNEVVPDTQRVICDGDVITSGPPGIMGYYPVGRSNIFDFTGTIRVDPSLVEKKYSLKTRNKASSHFMSNYLKNIKKAYHPVISEEELLNIMREAYGIKKKKD